MIDLHIHTTHSDGQLKVVQILQRAKDAGIDAISFCDHNVVGAYEELAKFDLSNFGIKIIPGVEFDFVHKGKDFHMLGYNFDWRKLNKSRIIDKKTPEDKMEEERRHLIFLKEVCKKLNIKIDDSLDIKSPNEKASTILKYHMMEFEENSQILDEMLGKNREKSFARGFVHNPNSPFFIDMTIGLPTAQEVADEIHKCGGMVFLAHPFDYKDIDHKKYIQEIFDLGILDGIECIHTRHTLEQINYIKEVCRIHNLKISGGSDFHRDGRQRLGYGVNGTIEITQDYLFKNIEREVGSNGREI